MPGSTPLVSQLTTHELRELQLWLWWAQQASLAEDHPEEIATLCARWSSAATREGVHYIPAWLSLLIGLSMSYDPLDQSRLDHLCSLSIIKGKTTPSQPIAPLIIDPVHTSNSVLDFNSYDLLYPDREVFHDLSEALSSCRSRWLQLHLNRREGREVINKFYQLHSSRSGDDHISSQLMGLLISHLLAPLTSTQRPHDSQHGSTGHPVDIDHTVDDELHQSLRGTFDPVTLDYAIREPTLFYQLPSFAPSVRDLQDFAQEITQVTALLLSPATHPQNTTHDVLTYRDSSDHVGHFSSTRSTLVLSQVVEHFEVLITRSRRLAFERLTRAIAALGPPQGITRSPLWNSPEARLQRITQVAQTGGLQSLSRRGSLENVCRSEVAYLGQELAPGIDGFTLRWLEGDLLFYQRDQDQHRASVRTWSWRFFDSAQLAQDHIGISKLDIAHLVSLWVQRSALLTLEEASKTTDGSVSWSWTHGALNSRAAESRELLSLLATPDIDRGQCILTPDDQSPHHSTLEFLWTNGEIPQEHQAIIIDLNDESPCLRFSMYWRRVFACSATLPLQITPSPITQQDSEVHSNMITLAEAISMVLRRWFLIKSS